MMKTHQFAIAATLLFGFYGCNNNPEGQTAATELKDSVLKQTETAVVPMDSAAQAKAWDNYMTPGDMHRMLAAANGKWEGEQQSWMEAGAEPTPPAKISADYSMVLGGRYQQSIYTGDMMGMPFEGRCWTAYDNATKKFVSVWIDNFGTGIMHTEGVWDDANKALDMKGTMTDPLTGKATDVRQVTKFPDDKHQVFEMYCQGKDGKTFKQMEIKLAKK